MFAVTILGNNSALPMHDRHPTAQVVMHEEHLMLVDCGEATQMQMTRYKIRRSRIHHIFISHLHGDHYFGLPGLLNSYSLNGRKEDLHLYAPPLLQDILNLQFAAAHTELTYALHFHPLTTEGLILDERKYTVECFPVTHRIECWGFVFREKEKLKKLIPEKLKAYQIPSSFYSRLKMGEDYIDRDGNKIYNDWVTQAGAVSRSYAFCADTQYDENIVDKVKDVTVLYHESTYLDDLRERAWNRYHSTAKQAATIALKAGAGRLLLGHFSSKYEELDGFQTEAEAVFPNSELALEGVTYRI